MAVIEELAAEEKESPDNTTKIEDGVKTMSVDELPDADENEDPEETTIVPDEPTIEEEPVDPEWANVRDLLRSDDFEEVIKGMNELLEESDEATMLLDKYYWDIIPTVAKSVGLKEKSGAVSNLAEKVLRRVGLNSPAKEVPIAIFPHLETFKQPTQSIQLLKAAAVATSRVETMKIRHNLIDDITDQSMKILEKDMLKSLDSVRLALVVLKPLLPTVVKEVGKSINGEAVKAMARLIWVSFQALDSAAEDESTSDISDKSDDYYQPDKDVIDLVYLLADTPGLGVRFLLDQPRRCAYQFWKYAKEADILPYTLEEYTTRGDFKWSMAGIGHFAYVIILLERFPIPISPIYRLRLLLPGTVALLDKMRTTKSHFIGLKLVCESTSLLPKKRTFGKGVKPPILLEYRNWGPKLKRRDKVELQKKRPGWLQAMPDANDVIFLTLIAVSSCPSEAVGKLVMTSVRQIIDSVNSGGRCTLLKMNIENLRVPSVTGLLWDILRENMVQARKDAKAKRETRGEGKKKKIPFIGEDIRSFMTQRTKATMLLATPNKPECLLEQVENLSGIMSIWKYMIQSSKPPRPGKNQDETPLLDDPWEVRDRGSIASLQLNVDKLKDELEYTNDKDPRLGLLLHNLRELSETIRPMIEALYLSR